MLDCRSLDMFLVKYSHYLSLTNRSQSVLGWLFIKINERILRYRYYKENVLNNAVNSTGSAQSVAEIVDYYGKIVHKKILFSQILKLLNSNYSDQESSFFSSIGILASLGLCQTTTFQSFLR